MKEWKVGDTCYFTGVKGHPQGFGIGKAVLSGKIVDIKDAEVLVDVPNGYKTPWLKHTADLFDTEEECKEMVSLEISEMPNILDIISAQPIMAQTPGTPFIRYTYATNSPSQHGNQSQAPTRNGDEGSVSPRKPQEEGDTGGIQGYYQVPPLHL